jgi:SpoIID/LytB domain protein
MAFSLQESIELMFSRELSFHGRAFVNNQALSGMEIREFDIDGYPARLLYNPAREASVMADVSEETIRNRQCFLCEEGLSPEQLGTVWRSPASQEDYIFRVNPFPIFDLHFTISLSHHKRQQLEGHFADMAAISHDLPYYTIFYNGPMCGASAPDHLHFQAVPAGNMPSEVIARKGQHLEPVYSSVSGTISRLCIWSNGSYVLRSKSREGIDSLFSHLMSCAPIFNSSEWEPRVNVLSWWEADHYAALVHFRRESRPTCFTAEDPQERILISPACVEMSGVAIVSSRDSFNLLTADKLKSIIEEVSLDKISSQLMENKLKRTQAELAVGIFSEERIEFSFNAPYSAGGKSYKGDFTASVKDGKVLFDGEIHDQIIFTSREENASFILKDVTIGVEFHWERKEDQVFAGNLKLIVEKGRVTAINLIGIEDYLISVISSEMSATSSKQLLKAHAVISRSWTLAQIVKNKEITASEHEYSACIETEDELIKWYDREDHTNFDVCADDHCQRYQGLTRASTEAVREVIEETWGEVLTYDGKICDARFSKCCGGIFEEFPYCWEDKDMPYLRKQFDNKSEAPLPDLTIEENAREWIYGSPEAFCNTTDQRILSQVLNSYDQETLNFFRWKEKYSQQELSELIKSRSGVDYGEIIDLVPLARGTSGRLWKLKIVGSKRSRTIGKELEIRRTLSPSHLYSSAFVVEKEGVTASGAPASFTLVGAGWGHGVGLCQIGAAVMGDLGYDYKEILFHYFTGASIDKQY